MRVSREQVALNREKILEVAGNLFRAHGYDAVTVADVMNAAGLTHGGFYGYFKSKDELIAQTLDHVYAQSNAGDADLMRYAANYLSPAHRDNVASGCPTAALGAETARQTPEARAAMTAGVKGEIERFSKGRTGEDAAEARKRAIAIRAAMAGALIFARLVDDPALSDEVLEATREWIADQGLRNTA
jgi:TetR/AcrR family transcriptional regulator, transcriptional repressor for nem operon